MLSIPEIEIHIDDLRKSFQEIESVLQKTNEDLNELRQQLQVGRLPQEAQCVQSLAQNPYPRPYGR